MATGAQLAGWTGPEIVAECRSVYRAYRTSKTDAYRAYFAANGSLKDARHDYKAASLAAALPDGWAGLGEMLPESERHLQHLSGNSSQVLALGLLGVGSRLDASLDWLWNALSPLPPAAGAAAAPSFELEYRLARGTLDERPRQTSIDLLVRDPAVLLCIEAKWTEAGMGGCGCGEPAAAISDCSAKVRERRAYADAARDIFGLPDRADGQPCRMSFAYQAIRNAAAAMALAESGQEAVFGLIFDAANPCFAGHGNWPGWPAALRATLRATGSPIRFASVSWQELLRLLPLDEATIAWASAKHGLRRSTAPG